MVSDKSNIFKRSGERTSAGDPPDLIDNGLSPLALSRIPGYHLFLAATKRGEI